MPIITLRVSEESQPSEGRPVERVRLTVDGDSCVGSGMCASIAPGVFVLDDEMRSTVPVSEVDATPAVWEAIETCPVAAILGVRVQRPE